MLRYGYRWRIVLALALVLLAFALLSTYAEVKKKVIADFNAQQQLLAEQAAKGIRQHFERFRGELAALSFSRDIVEMTPAGQAQLQSYLELNQDQLRAITRLDAQGRILYTVPYLPERIGADITGQEHVARLLNTHQPVISDVFTAVQGYQAVAYHIPLERDGRFDGSLAFVIPFEYLARDHFFGIKPAPGSLTWAFSKQLVELYCAQEAHVGREVSAGCGRDAAVQELVKQVVSRENGITAAVLPWAGAAGADAARCQVAFTKIELNGTFWYLVVATPEAEILATMAGFRNRLLLLAATLLMIGWIVIQVILRERLSAKEAQFQQRALEEKAALAAQYQQAQRLEAIGRLAAGVAHDFNNMLTPILGYADLLLDDAEPGTEAYAALADIRQAALRARELTQQLLAFGRRQPLNMQHLDLNKVATGLARLLQRTLHENIKLQLDASATPCLVHADRGQLEQVLLNLAINAQDAMPGGGLLKIGTATELLESETPVQAGQLPPGSYCVLSVADSGPGIDLETRANIFEPFFSTKGEHGTGLGLATVHGIVTQHGGGIEVRSSPGAGAEFKVLLPRATASTAAPPPQPAPAAAGNEHATVLLVEDDAQVRRLTARMLAECGYSVCQAADAHEALELLQARMPGIDLLLTDVIMPGMNGQELYAVARGSWPQLKVLYISGYAADVLSRGGLLQAGVQLLDKPFSKGELEAQVRQALEGGD